MKVSNKCFSCFIGSPKSVLRTGGEEKGGNRGSCSKCNTNVRVDIHLGVNTNAYFVVVYVVADNCLIVLSIICYYLLPLLIFLLLLLQLLLPSSSSSSSLLLLLLLLLRRRRRHSFVLR